MAMDRDVKDKIRELEIKIKYMPKGSITQKNISGHSYPYHQWQEDGKKYSVYLHEDEVDYLSEKIEERKKLQNELKELKKPGASAEPRKRRTFTMPDKVFMGRTLEDFIASYSLTCPERREGLKEVRKFLESPTPGRIMVLYGLRRTGKTVMMAQSIEAMSDADRAKTAYVSLDNSDTIDSVGEILTHLFDEGIRYVFLDEVTSIDGFVNYASMFSDVYASRGMKIVLAGTDSLGFWLAGNDSLFDRAFFVRTTYIPFAEWSRLMDRTDIDDYIRFGGTLSPLSEMKTDERIRSAWSDMYVENAVSMNIQNSLLNKRGEHGLVGVQELFDRHELTNAINRIVADMNHRFCAETIKEAFKSGDLSLTRRNLSSARDPDRRTDLLYLIDSESVTERLMQRLGIMDKERQTVEVTDYHVECIRKYLERLDLIEESTILTEGSNAPQGKHVIFTQPGLRYAQAEALIGALSEDAEFSSADMKERKTVIDAIRSEVSGRMMEDIVILDTMHSLSSRYSVFKLVFELGAGEYDMVVRDDENGNCSIFEIKHSSEEAPGQRRHLLNPDFRTMTEKMHGEIKGTYVIYRGEEKEVDGVEYLNVEHFLRALSIIRKEVV